MTNEHEAGTGWPAYSQERLLHLCCGDTDAARMILMIAEWTQVYDDLIDKDKPVSDERIHRIMWHLIVNLNTNPFFVVHRTSIVPCLAAGILNWHAANDMEASGDIEQLRLSHALRYSIGDFIYLVMFLVGGYEHAVQHARECRLMMQRDTWANYAKEHGHADPI